MAAKFFETIYLAGLKESYETKHNTIRLLWTISFFAGFSVTAYCIYNVVVDYNDNPTATKVLFEVSQEYSFPEIHVAIGFKLDMLKENTSIEAMLYLKSFATPMVKNETLHAHGKQDFLKYAKESNLSSLKFMYRAIATHLNNFVTLACTKCDSIIDDDYFVFPTTISKEIKFENYTSKLRGLETFEINSLTINVNDTESVRRKSLYFQVAIGSNFRSMFYFDNQMHITDGYEYVVGINAKRVKRYNKHSKPCIEQIDYSPSYCALKCISKAFTKCGNCTFVTESYNMNINNITMCSSLHASVELCLQKMNDYFDICSSNCLPKCDETSYDFNVMNNLLVEGNKDYYAQLLFKLLYKNSGILTFDETPSYTLLSAISNIGGQFGLWLGVSILTMVQVVLYMLNMWMDKSSSMLTQNRGVQTKN